MSGYGLLGGAALAIGLMGCAHSDAFTAGSEGSTSPLSAATPFRLTYSAGDDYWPSWTADGGGVLYRYAQPGLLSDDRCMALLPPSGGSWLWSLCDTRREHVDSADSFVGADIGADGRLLYVESSSRRGSGGASGVNPPPQSVALWLADTARPFTRRLLLALPTPVNSVSINWLQGLRWTDQASFLGLAQVLTPHSTCPACAFFDSMITPVSVVRGNITSAGATLTPVTGTDQAIAYALADNGASLLFVQQGSRTVRKVPTAGGNVTDLATIPGGRAITGLDCRGTICIVTTGTSATSGPLYRINLADGTAVALSTTTGDSPTLSPDGAATVVHSNGNLYLFKGIVP